MFKNLKGIALKVFKKKEGAEILQFVIIVALVAILAVAVIPPLGKQINNKAITSVDKVESINEDDFK